ncbi:hypothetical protein [Mycobacterium hubeiense]|uniref:hypothetical protein n=1 Tax=Mycobacterium hubeiense TaxID=1867256 RepID=UPI000C7EA8D2|nr:hypothetical protein [Mycobacterium sp. QGD 101]
MHVYITVAINGTLDADAVPAAVEQALAPYGEQRDVIGEDAIATGKWEGWIVGGRLANSWAITAHPKLATARLPRWQWPDHGHGSIARVRDITATSLTATTAYIHLDGTWHDSGRLDWQPTIAHDSAAARRWRFDYSAWITTLPADTWLVLIDAHR